MRGTRRKNLEFISAGKRKEASRTPSQIGRLILRMFPVAVIGAFLVLYAVLTFRTSVLYREAELVRGQIDMEENGSVKKDMEKLNTASETYHIFSRELEEWKAELEEIPPPDGDTIRVVYSLAGGAVEILSADYENGQLAIHGISDSYQNASAYAKALEDSGGFEEVSYEGFSRWEEEETSGYQFRIAVRPGRNQP